MERNKEPEKPTPRSQVLGRSYQADELKDLISIITRVNPSARISIQLLRKELLDLVYAVGRADDGSDEAAWFREAAAKQPSDAALAEQFRNIAKADDPLDPKLCFGIALTKLNQAARGRWTGRRRRRPMNRPHPLRDIKSDSLTADEIADVREMALHLARYHQSFIHRGQPNKLDQDTLLDGIADIYIRFAKLNCDRYDLPHTVNTRFITFAYKAMRPFFAQTEATKSALSKRWKRMKDAHGRPAE